MHDQRACELAVRDVTQQIEKCKSELTHLVDAKCPRCKQQYGDAEKEVTACRALLVDLQTKLDDINTELHLTQQLVMSLTQDKDNLKRSIQVENFDDLLVIKSQSDQMLSRLSDFEQAENPYLEPLQELLDTPTEQVSYDEVNTLTKVVDHQRFLLKLLTKKDSFVRKTLLNTNIPYLNLQLQHYMTVLGLPFRVEFTKELTAKITRFGRTMDFGNLSQGQRARVNLGLSFAFKDVLENIHKRKVNICMLDEVLDHGLDSVGVQAAARLVKQKGREDGVSMYIISHRHDQIDSVFDQKLVIQLSQGFSYVKEDQQ
jgi:chromosome segregation ATPase